ncbi:MAG: DNA ligase, partial [Corynebacterium sp.]|uniref:non-homologous end-joining DNA ligase LigD n=1 Tax=Corynebacterium sp. TaxID=1720 RepID=UPI002647F9BB
VGGESGAFFERNLRQAGTPDWVARRDFEHQARRVTYPLVNDTATMVWLTQLDTLEIHTPQWRYGPRGGQHNPDRMIFDLDPGDGAGLPECAEVAHFVKDKLDGMGLVSVPVTTGGSGIHVYAGLSGDHRASVVLDKVHQIADELAEEHPDKVVSEMDKQKRVGRVLVDWSQNDGVKSSCAPYSLRGRANPTVAAPRDWEEIDSDVRQLGYRQVMERVLTRGDPMDVLLDSSGADGGPSFVIHEHDATTLHWDLRLEHAGALASWAVPKGMPTDSGKDRLAIQTEDHPLAYRDFEGSIGDGEPGAGTVDIWDDGTYRVEKWQDDEIIVTLRGRDDGGLGGEPRKIALINSQMNGEKKNRLVHLMA